MTTKRRPNILDHDRRGALPAGLESEALRRFRAEQLPRQRCRILFPGEQPIGLQALGKLDGWHQPSPIMVGVDVEWASWYAYRAVAIADTDFTPSPPYFEAIGERHAEPHAERAGTARQHNAEVTIRPLSRLVAPAMDRVLEITDDGENGCRRPQRQPVDDTENPARKCGEIIVLCNITPLPTRLDYRCHAVEHCTTRPRQDDEAQQDAEDVAMWCHQGRLHRQAGDFLRPQAISRTPPPLGEQMARPRQVAEAQRQVNFGVMVAELAEPHGQVKNGDIEQQRQDGRDRVEQAIQQRIVEKYKVNVMFSAPTAARVLKKQDPAFMHKYDLSSLKHIFMAGEPLDETTHEWFMNELQKPVIDNYWQTETGWPMLAALPGRREDADQAGFAELPGLWLRPQDIPRGRVGV